MAKIGTLICDANILIDYLLDRGKILRLATKHCYDIYIPRQVLEEVRQLDEAALKNLGIKIIDPEIFQLMEAMEDESSLSPQDNLCFILARDNSWICATNEKSLSNKCKRENVAVIRGLKIMLELTKANVLSKGDAIDIADMIKAANKRITDEVINTFKNMLDKI